MERSRVGDSGAGCWRACLGGCQGLGTGWRGRAPWPWGSATRPLRALGKFYLDASGTEHDISACHQVFIAAGTSSVGRCLCRGFLGVVAPPPRARCPRRVLLTPECLRRWRAAWRKPLAGGALPTGSPVPAQVTKACEPCPGICDGPKPRLSLLFPLSPPLPPQHRLWKTEQVLRFRFLHVLSPLLAFPRSAWDSGASALSFPCGVRAPRGSLPAGRREAAPGRSRCRRSQSDSRGRRVLPQGTGGRLVPSAPGSLPESQSGQRRSRTEPRACLLPARQVRLGS